MKILDMMIKSIAGGVLVASGVACSSSGDTTALLIESAQACSVVCSNHPGIESLSYEAGGGSPLLFSGKVGASCSCSDAGR